MADITQASAPEIPSAAPPAGWVRAIGLVAVGLALLSAMVTFLVFSNLTPVLPTDQVVKVLLLSNALTILFLIAVIAGEFWRVFQARRHGRTRSRRSQENSLRGNLDLALWGWRSITLSTSSIR
jgi:two-component system nitrogen regulation sensor histidine kinase NtrY